MSVRVSLRPITGEDTDLIVKWRNNPRVRENFVFRETFTRELHEKWLAEHVEGARDTVQWIILTGEAGQELPVGSVFFRNIDRDADEAEYGIFIGEDNAVGLGISNQVISMALERARGELNLKRIVLRVFCDNTPAIRSYEHAGFTVTETRRHVRCTDGEERDMYFMEKIL
ncbi:MAG: GNAT family N-acetyltransferase [Lachnospiraceae bacterium]|nr:GNAT family N-acetyltransferase [Lachnospiraceae bacterium]